MNGERHPNWEINELESLERCKIINSLLGDNVKMEKNTQKILTDVAKKVPIDDVKKIFKKIRRIIEVLRERLLITRKR